MHTLYVDNLASQLLLDLAENVLIFCEQIYIYSTPYLLNVSSNNLFTYVAVV